MVALFSSISSKVSRCLAGKGFVVVRSSPNAKRVASMLLTM